MKLSIYKIKEARFMILKRILKNKSEIIKATNILRFSRDKPEYTVNPPQQPSFQQKQPISQQAMQKQVNQHLALQNYHIDLKLSSLYQQILQKQRLRMQRNQLHIQQMLQKERQRSDKRQQQMHDQITQFMKSLQTVIGVGGLMGLVYYIFTVVNQGGEAFEKVKKYWRQGYQRFQLIQKYSKNQESVPQYYLENNSVEKQLAKIQFDGIIGLSYLVGIPGSGKTTALKKVVHDLRSKINNHQQSFWSKVYYINLRVDDESGRISLQKTKQRIDEMMHLMKFIFSSKYYYERALIVIDDIQVLDRVLTQNQRNQILDSILIKSQMKSCKFVAVSSSSYSYYRALHNPSFKKSAFLTQIQSLNQEQLIQVLKKRVKYQKQVNGIQIDQSILKFFQEKYDSIKNMMNTINYVVNEYRINAWLKRPIEVEKLAQKLKQRQSNRVWQMRIDITKMLRQKTEKLGIPATLYLLKCILELPQQVKLGNKFLVVNRVINKYPKLGKYSDQVNNIIEELDRLNMLIFGRPRSKLQRRALEAVLRGFA